MTDRPKRKPKIHKIVKTLGLSSVGFLIFAAIVMALGREADIKVESEMVQGIWVASIVGASILAVLSWLLADSTIQQD